MPDVYEGDRPYVFVSYAHADGAAMPIIRALVDEGYRVWWDDGIQVGSSFPDYIADRLFGCSCVLMLVSRSSLTSGWCRNEVEYALDLGRPVLPVYLEDVELPRAFNMRLGSVQALYWFTFTADVEFNEILFAIPMLNRCLTVEGKSHRGVKPRYAGFDNAQMPGDAIAAHLNPDDFCVSKRSSLSEYSWAELKSLSRTIASARNDAEGLFIAKSYCLVGEDSKLCGDEKPLMLTDGTRTGVRILGFRQDDLSGGGKAGMSFEFVNIPSRHAMNSDCTNEGGWKASAMREWLNSDFFGLLPRNLSQRIASVRKWSNNRGEVSLMNDTSVATVTTDRLWLLSLAEVYGELGSQVDNVPWSSVTYDIEGTQYQLYVDRGVTTTSYTFCKKHGIKSWWWLRSARAGFHDGFLIVGNMGVWGYDNAPLAWGVSPGFCL